MCLEYKTYAEMLTGVRELNCQGFKFKTDYINYILFVNL